MKIYTSYYTNPGIVLSGLIPVRISVGAPRFKLPYKIAGVILELLPERDMIHLPAEEYDPLYREILAEETAEKIQQALSQFTGDVVLLCFCKPELFCHRHVFADWWQKQTGEIVTEL